MNHYFLTGATGNIGSALVPLLMECDGTIQLLIRADNDEHLLKRFDELCKFWEISRDAAIERMIPCRGDMTEPFFGLNGETYAALAESCTHIIHCGGAVRMNLPLEEARKSAVGSVEEIISLAERARQEGRLKKIDIVSTVGVIGRSKSPLTEKLITENRTFHNTYEQAKAEAEEMLYAYMASGRLPITIHRPSMVVGDSKTGKVISFQVFYHLCEFVSGKRTFGLLPDFKGVNLDIIPVDYVVQVIRWSAKSNKTVGKIIHECSGPDAALNIQVLEETLESYPYFSNHTSYIVKKKRYIPPALFNIAIVVLSIFLPKKDKKIIRTLPHFLEYIKYPQLFYDKLTVNYLPRDLQKPLPAAYLDIILTSYQSTLSKRV
jgi:thioester reductase-like protein